MKIATGIAIPLMLAACGDPDGPVTDIGESVYTSNVQTLVFEGGGAGLVTEPQRDTQCDLLTDGQLVERYAITTMDHTLAWSYCAVDRSGSIPVYVPENGARALTDAEWSSLEPKLRALVVVDRGFCGADAARIALIVSTPSYVQEYGDGFYGCENDSLPLVSADGLYALGFALGQLSGG